MDRMSTTTFDDLIAIGEAADVTGWDFSWLDGRATEDREALGRRLAAERGLILVPPYDDRRVIAGAGTLGLEVARQAEAMGAAPNALVVCCAGGGLTVADASTREKILQLRSDPQVAAVMAGALSQ